MDNRQRSLFLCFSFFALSHCLAEPNAWKKHGMGGGAQRLTLPVIH